MTKLYNLLEGSTVILSAVPVTAIREYLGRPNAKMADYTKHDRMVMGKYRITEAGEIRPEKRKKTIHSLTAADCMRWEMVCRRFQGYVWTDDPKEAKYQLAAKR